jgi:hypothetical protein
MGYTVIRFWNHEILGGIDAVLEVILKVLMDLSPLPGLSLGERGKNRVAARLANEWYPSA